MRCWSKNYSTFQLFTGELKTKSVIYSVTVLEFYKGTEIVL